MGGPVRVLQMATAPLLTARRAADDLAALLDRADQLLALGRELQSVGHTANANAARLIEVGNANVDVGGDMLELARANVDGNRETNVALRELDARLGELLSFTVSLEKELPALRVLSEAAPPMQAAAERVERVAGRIPGIRG
jgi:hypothetical protein